MTDTCVLCGWLLDGEHAFNVNCAVANAENDQLEAELRDLEQQPSTADDERLIQIGLEAARDVLALKRFERMLSESR